MRTVQVYLPTQKAVQAFVDAITPLTGDFELHAEGYILDARSLMGIFTFDLTKPLDLKVFNDVPEVLNAIAPFMVQKGEATDG